MLENEKYYTVAVRVPPKVVAEIDSLVKKGYYKNRSDLILTAIRERLR